MKKPLYERLGGNAGIAAIAGTTVDNHLKNPLIRARFASSDAHRLKELATRFFCAGTGGPECYEGKDMRAAHLGMNISEQEYVAVMDDILSAMKQHRVGAEEQNEVVAVLYGLKNEIIRV